MNSLIKKIKTGVLLLCIAVGLISCKEHLMDVNVNPNGAVPETTNPNMVLSTVLTEAGMEWVNLGFGNLMGTMQYTQKDGHSSSYNNYEWKDAFPWTDYYVVLRNNKFVHKKAIAANNELLEGVSLVMRALMFGLIADLYGDIPYKSALNANKGGRENSFPAFSTQKEVYLGILKELDTANTLLSKPRREYKANIESVDVYYQGDPTKWRKLANSLALRYYMRISEKLPQVAKEGIEKIANNPNKYPVILSSSDDCLMGFPGNSNADSWPHNTTYDAGGSNYRRIKMCNTFVQKLLQLDDPRLGIWAQKVEVFLKVGSNFPSGTQYVADTTINGEPRKVLYLSPDQVNGEINQNENYVGLPVALLIPYAYNMSTDLNQSSFNKHVSWLNPIYKQASGPLLKARIMSAAEVHFILAEAKAVKGWTNVDAEQQYYAGIKASFEAWNTNKNNLAAKYAQYISQPDVVYDGTQQQIITQKWIANWTVAQEAWFDFRRTGFPDIHGVQGRTLAPELPVRFYYPGDAQFINKQNYEKILGNLEVTQYSGFGTYGAKNSIWSKTWLLQGTGEPW